MDTQIVISASRRTDIPAFYMPWFMESIKKGFFEVINPYNRRVSIVNSSPDHVHTIVFWSKNFAPFLKEKYGQKLKQSGYNLFFNFTLNSSSPVLEPNIPSLSGRLEQIKSLCENFGDDKVIWRFDPICFYKTRGSIKNNLADFPVIAEAAHNCGIKTCITSFMDNYAKIDKRVKKIGDFSFIEPEFEKKKEVILKMERFLSKKSITLYLCCEKDILQTLDSDSQTKQSSCIPNDLLMQLYGGKISLRKDAGQRVKQGCGCRLSADIGSYHLQPCYHNCLFCYANPSTF